MAECVGVHVVGYAIMLYGIGGTMGSFISGKLLALKTRWLVILGTLFFHLIIITFLVIWDREPILLLLLFISLAWGTCDGSWITICNSKFKRHLSCMHEPKMKCVLIMHAWLHVMMVCYWPM